MKKQCLECKNEKCIIKQGLCYKCLNKLTKEVEAGTATWSQLAEEGRATLPQRRRKKTMSHSKNDVEPATIKEVFNHMHELLNDVETICNETIKLHKRFLQVRENMVRVTSELHRSKKLQQDLISNQS